MTRSIAHLLVEVSTRHGLTLSGEASRRAALRKLAVKFVKDGVLHQVFDYDRGPGAWVGACGTPYEGNGWVESSTPGDSTCVACIAEE